MAIWMMRRLDGFIRMSMRRSVTIAQKAIHTIFDRGSVKNGKLITPFAARGIAAEEAPATGGKSG